MCGPITPSCSSRWQARVAAEATAALSSALPGAPQPPRAAACSRPPLAAASRPRAAASYCRTRSEGLPPAQATRRRASSRPSRRAATGRRLRRATAAARSSQTCSRCSSSAGTTRSATRRGYAARRAGASAEWARERARSPTLPAPRPASQVLLPVLVILGGVALLQATTFRSFPDLQMSTAPFNSKGCKGACEAVFGLTSAPASHSTSPCLRQSLAAARA